MRRLLFLLLFSFLYTFSFSQERNDGVFVVHLMETDAQDLKCDVGVTPDYIKSLMNSGRHVMSTIPTKFGTIVLHEKSKTNMAQQYIKIPGYDLKKGAKKLFKKVM